MRDPHKPEADASETLQTGRAILPDLGSLALFTDLYELRMAQAYFEEGMDGEAVFTLFVRRLPERRNFLLACGLDAVLGYLESVRFTDGDLAYLATVGGFAPGFLEHLKHFRFTGEVRAVPEGTPIFANEPILEVAAPIAQAQIAETLVMNQVTVQTVLASKAARVVQAAQGRTVVDFGARRMHGIDAAIKAARAFYIAGVASTSNVLAGSVYGIPVAGTMAHSYVQAHASEEEAFRAFARLYPGTIILVDTYDTIEGVRRVIALAKELGEDFKIGGVRLDSGDLGKLAHEARAMLDAAGLHKVEIFASSGLDEEKVAELVRVKAPIEGFGVGTAMAVSADKPDLDIVYKLSEYAGTGRIKLSPEKQVLPGRKQIFRNEADGEAAGDTIAAADEALPGRPLLRTVMRGGRRLAGASPGLKEIRAHAVREIAALPDSVRALAPARPDYNVTISEELQRRHARVAAQLKQSG